MKNRSYSELIGLKTFEERYRYLKLSGIVGEASFGSRRYLNQDFYRSKEWKNFRSKIILRDNGCDLAIPGREITSRLLIHHINPITIESILDEDYEILMDPENVVCVSNSTHQAIHYGDESVLCNPFPIKREPRDTCPWERR